MNISINVAKCFVDGFVQFGDCVKITKHHISILKLFSVYVKQSIRMWIHSEINLSNNIFYAFFPSYQKVAPKMVLYICGT